MSNETNQSTGVSRRTLLNEGAAMAGALTIGTGIVTAHHGNGHGTQGGHALVRVGHYIPGEPFTLRFETDFDKPRSCQDANAPETNWACYTMNYVASDTQKTVIEGFDFEVRPEADYVDGPKGEFGDTKYVLGPEAHECRADFPGDWLSTSFRPV